METPRGLTVTREAPAAASYREAERQGAFLEIRWRWWRPHMWRQATMSLLLVALDLLAVLGARYFLVEMEDWTGILLVR